MSVGVDSQPDYVPSLGAPSPPLPAGHRLASIAEQPELWEPLDRLCGSVWPEIMLHDDVPHRLWDHLRVDWPQFQLGLVAPDGAIVAAANAAPLVWDGTDAGLPDGWDDQFERTVGDLRAGRTPDTLGALQIVVAPERRSTGLSSVMLAALRGAASSRAYRALIACVRPTLKARYPLLPIETYAAWQRHDGLPFDPWLRVHVRAGARIVRPSPRSMTIAGSVADLAAWTGLSFPVSGPYVVEGALEPVQVDLETDTCVYYDPNIWVVHDLPSEPA